MPAFNVFVAAFISQPLADEWSCKRLDGERSVSGNRITIMKGDSARRKNAGIYVVIPPLFRIVVIKHDFLLSSQCIAGGALATT